MDSSDETATSEEFEMNHNNSQRRERRGTEVRSEQEVTAKYEENKEKKSLKERAQNKIRKMLEVDEEDSHQRRPSAADRFGTMEESFETISDDRPNGERKLDVLGSLSAQAIKAIRGHYLLNYDFKKSFWPDFSTGLLVGIVLIPQGLSYGLLAELPAYYGLYCSMLAPIIYGFLGSSNELSLGPFALVSILIPDTVGNVVPYDGEDQQEYIDAVMTTGFLTGCILLLLWLFRMGEIVNLLSNPVLTALTTSGSFLDFLALEQ